MSFSLPIWALEFAVGVEESSFTDDWSENWIEAFDELKVLKFWMKSVLKSLKSQLFNALSLVKNGDLQPSVSGCKNKWYIFMISVDLRRIVLLAVTLCGDIRFRWSWHRLKAESEGFSTAQLVSFHSTTRPTSRPLKIDLFWKQIDLSYTLQNRGSRNCGKISAKYI